MDKVWHTRGWVATPGAKSSLLAVDPVLRVNGQDAVSAVLTVAVIPNRLDVEAETFAGDSAADHVLIVNVKINVGDGLAVLEDLVGLLLQGGDCLGLLSLDGLVDNLGAEVDGHKLAVNACAVGARAELREPEKVGQLLANVVVA